MEQERARVAAMNKAFDDGILRSQQVAVAVQTRTFRNWINAQLLRGGHAAHVVQGDLFEALSNGVTLIHLFAALFAARGVATPKYNANPTVKAQRLDNVSAALAMLPRVGIMTVFIGAENVVNKDQKMVLGLVWRLVLAKQIVALGGASGAGASGAAGTLGGDDRKIDQSAKAALLEWVRTRLAPYAVKFRLPPVDNFSSSWSDGRLLLALVHSADPSLVALHSVDASQGALNVERALALAHDALKIPRLLEVDDVIVAKPDEKCIMTYVSEFAFQFEQLGHAQQATLSEREQALAMREAELEREKFLQQEEQERQLHELRLKELSLQQSSAELHAQQQRLAEAEQRLSEAARQQQAYVAQQSRDREERARMEEERNRLARERDELEARLRQHTAADAARDDAEKSFADVAHAFEGFLVAENRNIETANTKLLLLPHIERGTDWGTQMLDKVRAEDARCRQLGIVHNRFTRLDVALLEAQWARLLAFMAEKRAQLDRDGSTSPRRAAPPPPAVPDRRKQSAPAPATQPVAREPAPLPTAQSMPDMVVVRKQRDPNVVLWWCPKCSKKVEIDGKRHCLECGKYVI